MLLLRDIRELPTSIYMNDMWEQGVTGKSGHLHPIFLLLPEKIAIQSPRQAQTPLAIWALSFFIFCAGSSKQFEALGQTNTLLHENNNSMQTQLPRKKTTMNHDRDHA